jgi:Lipid A 3-O-deacylase (PagL)
MRLAVLLWLLLIACAPPSAADIPSPPDTSAKPIAPLRDGHLAIGGGGAFTMSDYTGSLISGAVTWNDDRYELFVARLNDQIASSDWYGDEDAHIGLAPPLRLVTASRRFNIVDRSRFRAFLGAGVGYVDATPCIVTGEASTTIATDAEEPVYRGCDHLNGSSWNFALQAGFRGYNRDHSLGVDLAYRHLSNAGLTSGNHGQDFITLMVVF